MKKKTQILGPCLRDLKKIMEHEGNGDTNYDWCAWNSSQKLEELKIGRQAETFQTTILFKIGQNPGKSPGNLRRFAVTQTPGKYQKITRKE